MRTTSPGVARWLKVTIEPLSSAPFTMLQAYGFKPDTLFTSLSASCTALALRIYDELRAKKPAADLMLEGLTLELLGEFCRLERRLRNAGAPAWATRIRDKIHQEFARPLTIAECASAERLHPIYLAQAFKGIFGVSIGRYVRQLRVDHAVRMMASKTAPLAEIALACGFYDQAHFTRVFKQHTALTPSAFRRLMRPGSRSSKDAVRAL